MHFSSLRHVFSFILTASVISAPLHAQGDRVVKIGLIEDASGRLGEMGKKGIEQFTDSFKTINAGGGIAIAGSRYSLQLIVFDAESRIDKANQGVARLVAEDKVDILISAYPITQDAARNTNAPILVLAPNPIAGIGDGRVFSTPIPNSTFRAKGGMAILTDALSKAHGVEASHLRDALAQVDVRTLGGLVRFDKLGNNTGGLKFLPKGPIIQGCQTTCASTCPCDTGCTDIDGQKCCSSC